jgi:inhibitor of growth protein 4
VFVVENFDFLGVKATINQTRQLTKYCLGLASQSSKKGNNHNNNNNYYYSNSNYNNNQEDEAAIEKMRNDIEANQDNALSLCTEKVLLARQAYDLVGFFY